MPKKPTSESYPFSFVVAFICISEALVWSLCFSCASQGASAAFFIGSVNRFSSLETPHPELLDQVVLEQPETLDSLPFFQPVSYLHPELESPKLEFGTSSVLVLLVKLLTPVFIPCAKRRPRENDC